MWRDKWITSDEEGKIKTVRQGECNVEKVEELMQEGDWNEELLNKWFEEEDVQKILAIPLSLTGGRDKMYWKYTTSGQFTVKSAYAAEREGTRQQHELENREGTSYLQQRSRG